MTLVDNTWDRESPNTQSPATASHDLGDRRYSETGRSYSHNNTSAYFGALDITAAALSGVMLLAPLSVAAFGG